MTRKRPPGMRSGFHRMSPSTVVQQWRDRKEALMSTSPFTRSQGGPGLLLTTVLARAANARCDAPHDVSIVVQSEEDDDYWRIGITPRHPHVAAQCAYSGRITFTRTQLLNHVGDRHALVIQTLHAQRYQCSAENCHGAWHSYGDLHITHHHQRKAQ